MEHLRHETVSMQGGGAETLATKSTNQAHGQLSLRLTKFRHKLTVGLDRERRMLECPGVHSPAKLLGIEAVKPKT